LSQARAGRPTDVDPEESDAESRVLGGRAPWWLFFVVLTVMAVLWSLSIPLMGGPDEPAHALKAVGVADGQLTTEVVRREGAAGFVRFTVPDTALRVPRAYSRLNVLSACWSQHPEVPVACAPPVGTDESEVAAATYVGTYPPLYYAITGWPTRLLGPEDALYAMRIVSGTVCAALLAAGLAAALRLGRMLLAGAALAITPMTIFMMGTLNPNAMEVAAAFCLWLVLLELLTHAARAPTRAFVWAAAAGVLLTASRPLSPAFLVTIVAVVGLLAGSRESWHRLWGDMRARVAGAVVGVAAAASIVFVVVNSSLSSFIEFGSPEHPSRLDIARTAFDATGDRIEQAVGILSWTGPAELHLPHWIVTGWIVAALLLAALGLVVGSWRSRVVLVATLVGSVALPIVALASNQGGAGWQGRYGLPLLIGIPIVAGWTIDRSRRLPRTAVAALGIALASGVAIGYVLAHQRLMTRNVLGLPHSLFAGLTGGVWEGPASPVALFVVAVAVSGAYAGLLIWPMWRDRVEVEEASGARART
jgi:hypothetical protein